MKRLAVCVGFMLMPAQTAVAQSLRCPSADDATPRKARQEFVAPYAAGNAALAEGRFRDAVSLADQAAPHAVDAQQLQAVLSIRSAALLASHEDIQLVSTLETRIKLGCFLRPGEADELGSQLDAARARANSRPQH